jgi:hypothetical protein
MVLICNNNILALPEWHKKSSIDKNAMSLILLDIKYNKEKFKETQYMPEKNNIYISKNSNDKTLYIKPINSKYKTNITN